MKSSRAQKAVEDIAELTGVEISEENVFLESIVTSNARLRLGISKVDGRVEVNRIPATFLWAHLMMPCTTIPFSIIAFMEAQKGNSTDVVKLIFLSILSVVLCYGFIIWVNRKAIRENPVLSYDLKKKLLIAGPQRRRIKRDAIQCIIALASIPRKAHRPTKRSELKLIFRADTSTGFDFVVIARNLKPYLPDYDDEITPFARGLKIPYLHVNLRRKEGYKIERIV